MKGKAKIKKIGLYKMTDVQLAAIANAANILSSMIGVGSDFDFDADKTVKAIDRFLKINGLKRTYK